MRRNVAGNHVSRRYSRSRREFLKLSSAWLTGMALLGSAGCGGANTGVRGRVTDEHAAGIHGLSVVAYELDIPGKEKRLAQTDTAATGDFEVAYKSQAYGSEKPDLKVRVFDFVG